MAPARRYLAAAALTLMLLPALGACAKRHLYAGDRRPDGEVAYIEAERYLLANVEVEIDGRQAGSLAQYYVPPGVAGGWPPGNPTTAVSVLPGRHSLAIRVASYGWVRSGQVACAAMSFTTQAGETYRLAIDQGALVMRNLRTGDVVAERTFAECPRQARAEPA